MKKRLLFFGLFFLILFGGLMALEKVYRRAMHNMGPSLAEEVAGIGARYPGGTAPADPVGFVGSSSLGRWEQLEADMRPLVALNHGFGGSELEHILQFQRTLIDELRPRAVVIYGGDNDLIRASHKTPASVLEQYQTLVLGLRELESQPRVYCLSIKASPERLGRWPLMRVVNQGMQAWVQQHEGIEYIDVASALLDERKLPRPELYEEDGIHLNAAGYALWSPILRERLLEDLVP